MKFCKNILLLFSLLAVSACVTGKDRHGNYLHIVKSGETLFEIGQKYGVPYKKIARDNRVSNPASIRIGQRLRINRGKQKEWKYQKTAHRSVFLNWPLSGKISSGFGRRQGDPHEGIDISAPRGSLIRAAAAGRITFSGWQRGYGRTLIIEHENGYSSLYAHCSKLLYRKGTYVARGKVIAKVGSSGRTTGSHLHFEYRNTSGRAKNPVAFLPKNRRQVARR